MPIIYNQFKGQRAMISVVANTETYTLNSFSQSQTDWANNTSSDTIDNLIIEKIIYTGPVTVSRGANVIFTTNSNAGGAWTLDVWGTPFTQYPTANLTIASAANNTVLVEIKKSWHGNTAY